MPGRPFHKTGMLARQIGAALVGVTARRVLRWLAFRGSPPGKSGPACHRCWLALERFGLSSLMLPSMPSKKNVIGTPSTLLNS